MRMLPRLLLLMTLLACAGCTKASDASLARRDHILAGPHGWIDVTLHAPTPASAPVAAAKAASAAGLSTNCTMRLRVDGEPLLQEFGDLAQADAAKSPLGYRVVVAAGALNTELTIAGCVSRPLVLALPLTLEKDHLALLEFDGQHLALRSAEPYAPATLDAVHDDVAKLHERGEATDAALSTLTRLALANVLLVLVVIAVVLVVAIRRRSR